MPKIDVKTFHTTTLKIEPPTSFEQLEQAFSLYQYTIPSNIQHQYRNGGRGARIIFAKIHNTLKEQIPYAYKSFQNATINGYKTWVVYVLVPKGSSPPTIQLPDARFALSSQQLSFTQMWNESWFNLLKLLQIVYFRGSESDHFVGRDDCYVYIKPHPKSKNHHICMQLKLSGWGDEYKVLRVSGEAHTFQRVAWEIGEGSEQLETYYSISAIEHGQMLAMQLTSAQVRQYLDKQLPIYTSKPLKNKRTHLNYHDPYDLETSRGYILHNFIEGYIEHLAQYVIKIEPTERTFYRLEPSVSTTERSLAVNALSPISVYDARHKHHIPLQDCLDLLSQALKEDKRGLDIQFQSIKDLNEAADSCVLVLQDGDPEDYQEGGLLYQHPQYKDPYPHIYKQYPTLSKQFFNVNTNGSSNDSDVEEYLNYTLLESSKIRRSLLTSLNQLFLKGIVLHSKEIIEIGLPFAGGDYLFMRKATYGGNSYEVLLWFDGNTPQFRHIFDDETRQFRREVAAKYGVNWDAGYEAMLNKYKPNRTPNEDLPSYDIVLTPGCFIDIEDLEERVLYKYPEIQARLHERTRKRNVAELKLSDKLNASKWAEYDEILEELAEYGFLSIARLAEEDAIQRIAPKIGVQPKNEKIPRPVYMRTLYRPYQNILGLFPSPKDDSLHMFEGIWYTDDHCYMVGNAGTMSEKPQPRAHLIRRFHFLQGEGNFEIIQPLLDATSVLFVRLDEYTVLPYYFHLIDLYVENYLLYSVKKASNNKITPGK